MTRIPSASSIRPGRPASAHLPALRPLLAAVLAIAPAAWATSTDISNLPLVTMSSGEAKPNLLFVMDSSGSMNWSYMPDDLGYSRGVSNEPFDGGADLYTWRATRPDWYGYRSAQCNGLAFDPTADYSPPLRSDGTSYPNVAFTKAPVDGYAYDADSTESTTNLSTSTGAYYYQYKPYTGSPAAMSWTYDSSGVVHNTFYNECSTLTSAGSSLFEKKNLSGASAAVKQAYANWYSYYSRRYLLMRTAMGRAIYKLDNNYRVGFSTIYDTQAKNGSNNFVDVKDFDKDQKDAFYTSLYKVAPEGGTNLPDALSEAGRYFAHKISGQSSDPMQYACQRNYTLISTDGYWNTNSADYALDGKTRVSEQDADEARPMRDNDGKTQTTTTTTYIASATSDSVAVQTRDIDWTRWVTASRTGPGTSKRGGTSPSNCTRTGYYLVTGKARSATETQTQTSEKVLSGGQSSYTRTVVVNHPSETVVSDISTTPVASGYTDSNVTVTYTDRGNAATDTTPHMPPDAAYSPQTTTSICTMTPPSAGDNISDVGDWSPSSPTYSTPTITTGAYAAVTSPPPVVTTTATGGSSDTLADVAEYYYKTDLRSSALGNCASKDPKGNATNVCDDIVTSGPTDPAKWQHMNTFTIGLGTSGTLTYDKDYLTQSTGTYVDLKSGAANWPVATTSGNAFNIDDLWHAAVNGRGQYYSALNSSLLSEAISSVVNAVATKSGSGAAAATSSLQLVAGDNNVVYQASYTTASWSGDLLAYNLNGDDLTIDTTPKWSAQGALDATMSGKTTSPRKIYFSTGASPAALALLTWDNLSTTQKAYFANVCPTTPVTAGVTPKATLLGQCSTLPAADIALANNGSNLLDYLSGVRTYESAVATKTTAALYRKRDHVLGDIIDSAPVYVGKPPFKYADAGYADFVTAQKARKPVVYAGANDGMLHAFSATTDAGGDGGTELWAFVPSPMLPDLYLLANADYATQHRYYVDGAPTMGDIRVGTTWKTIVVGGFNGGGKGYYALDITDPATPKLLWEFTDTNLGKSYGNPVITKRKDGTWVVVFGSGYNNADGLGHLFVVNAQTGAKLLDITTPAGIASPAGPGNPSGLAKINAWIENDTDNTATRFYGGDLLGNLWRFDIDSQVKPYQSALLLAQFLVGGTPQPITTRPQPFAVPLTSGNRAVIAVGTGRYLGKTDIADTNTQSIYAVADDLKETGWGDVRSGPNKGAFVKRTLTVDGTTATVSSETVKLSDLTVGGWWVDLPNSGERVSINMSMQYNTLVVGTTIPTADICDPGGKSWRYFLDATTGGPVSSNPVGALWDANAVMVGQGWVVDASGNAHILEIGSNGTVKTETPDANKPTPNSQGHRTSWRELTN